MSVSKSYGLSLTKDLIRVQVGTVMYAIEIGRIREIVNPLPLIELPRARASVLGVADYREQVVAVVDLRRLFGLQPEEPTRRTKWLILESGQGLVGVVVDAVHEVFSSESNAQQDVPVLDEHHRERGIKSAYRYDDRFVFLLDTDRIAEPALDVHLGEMPFLPSEMP